MMRGAASRGQDLVNGAPAAAAAGLTRAPHPVMGEGREDMNRQPYNQSVEHGKPSERGGGRGMRYLRLAPY